MRSFILCIAISIAALVPGHVEAQPGMWPPNPDFDFTIYQFSSRDHSLIAKVKYTTQKTRSALFNRVNPYNNDNPTIHGLDRRQYRTNSTMSIMIMRDSARDLGTYDRMISVSGSYNSYGIDFETDNQENYIVAGDLVGNNWNPPTGTSGVLTDSTQLLLFKTNQMGQILWSKIYGGSSAEYAVAIKKSNDGNMIVLAESQSSDGDVQGHIGGKDIWLLKINSVSGAIMWQKTLGSPQNEMPTDLELLPDGTMMISGRAEASSFAPSTYAGYNAFLSKLDASGTILWTKVFGGNGNDDITAIIPAENDFLSLGTSTSSDGDYPANAGGTDIYIMRHNSTGDIVWKKHYGNSQQDEAGDIVYVPCDKQIYVSYAKEFSNDFFFVSTPQYPIFSQRAGIQIGLDWSGNEISYNVDNFTYTTGNPSWDFNYHIFPTMAPNDRGGFLGVNLTHLRWETGPPPTYFGQTTRSFNMNEYGIPLKLNQTDSTLCRGQVAWGITFQSDTTFADTLRNGCQIDTLINTYHVHVINTADSVYTTDTTICAGQPYQGHPVSTTFDVYDTTNVSTICGLKRLIHKEHIFVPAPINVNLGADTTICKPGYTLSGSHPGATYLWSDGSVNSSLPVTNPGEYWLQITDSYGCKKRDSVIISISNIFLSIWHDTTITAGQSVTLLPQSNGAITWLPSSYLSCTACPTPVATPPATTTFYVQSKKDNCIVTDSVIVIINKGYYFFIPTAFTPNNDGKNDTYGPVANLISNYTMNIYNRWGELIFQTHSLLKGWDGKIAGVNQDSGIFVFMVTYTDPDNHTHFQKGNFVLIR